MLQTNNVGENIRKIREFKGIHRRYMAQNLNIGLTAYGNIERGKTKYIAAKRLEAIAKLLNVDPTLLEQLDCDTILDNFHNDMHENNIANSSIQVIELTPGTKRALIELNSTLTEVLKKIM